MKKDEKSGKVTTYKAFGVPLLRIDESEPPEPADENIDLSLDETLEYQLKIEEHADNFFEIKHKITFFLITAAVGSIGYTLNFATGRLAEISSNSERFICLLVASIMALLTVGLALLSMFYDLRNYGHNLRAYFDRKLYEAVDDEVKEAWAKARRRATYCQRFAFTFLFLSVLYQASLFVLLLI